MRDPIEVRFEGYGLSTKLEKFPVVRVRQGLAPVADDGRF
jgi:hypothetical protein